MKRLIFYGASDDLLELDGDMSDEFEAYNGAAVKLNSLCGEMLITAIYAPRCIRAPVWSIGIAPVDEDVPIPDWPITMGASGYSAILTIECPDDIQVEEVRDDG